MMIRLFKSIEEMNHPWKEEPDELFMTKDELREIRKKVRALRQQMKHSLVTEGKPNCFVD